MKTLMDDDACTLNTVKPKPLLSSLQIAAPNNIILQFQTLLESQNRIPILNPFLRSVPNQTQTITMNIDLVELFQNGGDLRLFQNPQQNSENFSMKGYVVVLIIGIEHHPGAIKAREKLRLVREPLNPEDRNTIKALNKRSSRVGHVEPVAAAILSHLIDVKLIHVEGIISDPGFWHNNYEVPCQVNILAKDRDISSVVDSITRGGLRFTAQSIPYLVLTKAEEGEGVQKSIKKIDNVFKLMEERVNGMTLVGPLEPNKEVIRSDLMTHQKEALGWMVYRENLSDLPPFWVFKDGLFVNELTDRKIRSRPEPVRGGIFADDMGTGKTLSLISLIGFDHINVNKKPRLMMENNVVREHTKTTLVICPASVLSTWETELREHTCSLKVYMYYGERTDDPEELQLYDLVLTSYSTLGVDSRESVSPLCKIKWWRVILDDAHVLKSIDARETRAVLSLEVERRWVVSGMFIRNNVVDLYPIMKFLRFNPFLFENCWNRMIRRPLSKKDPRGQSRLKVLLATISLMRTKEEVAVHLPTKVIETCFVELSSKEVEIYAQAEEEAKTFAKSFNGDVQRNYSCVLSLVIRLRLICTDIAFYRPDFKSLLSSTDFKGLKDVSKMPQLLEKMIALLQDGEDLECPICLTSPSKAVITNCEHVFCQDCILKTIRRASKSCPICRHPLSSTDLYAAPPESSEKGGDSSSKRMFLLKHLAESKAQNPSAKSVVFSQFPKLLSLLEEPLKASGFKVLLLDWKSDAIKRADVIQKFNASGSDASTVLLASSKVSSTGISLTPASTIYLLEPWWDPTLEEQAIDRVHRIGQKEAVKIVRIIAKNTIEERVLDLQERRRNLAKECFRRKGVKERRELDKDDIRLLLAL